MQQFKVIYFADCAASADTARRGLTVPFSPDDEPLYNAVAPLSSYTLRRLLGCDTYSGLASEALARGTPVATYCRNRLRHALAGKQPACGSGRPLHDSLQATFAGGRGGTLHEWYPYLEGYSPAFVETILRHYGPTARNVLDPFAGAGTTPVTAATAGLTGRYSEINPLCHKITNAKLTALRLEDDERERIVAALKHHRDDCDASISKTSMDMRLQTNYFSVFSESKFFDHNVFNLVLRTRTWLDQMERTDPNLALFATIAVLRSLVPASRLIRRGDLRFKNATEARRVNVDYLNAVREGLDLIASDLTDLEQCEGDGYFIGDDAKELDAERVASADALITSPPYLNGTNYFRNTKVELWFLRKLGTAKDLSRFRFRAVTAGINDVTAAKAAARRGVFKSEKVQQVVERIERDAYDRRIPQMVATYFGDLFLAFQACVPHLQEGALLAVDIGDSCYGNVHVPTDDVLAEILTGFDCHLEDRVVLRERLSHGGQPLRQTLQIFRRVRRNRRALAAPGQVHAWEATWDRFKAELPHQSGDMARRNWGHPLHSLCSYQGKLKPAIAHLLVDTFVPAGGRMLDPFAGVGTIPLEAALSGRRAFAFDISPPAIQITRAKLSACDPAECEGVIAALMESVRKFYVTERLHRQADAVRFNGPISEYFHPDTLREVIGAREYFLRNPPSTPAEAMVFACLLHILHGNRPYALSRTSHPITPFAPTGPTTYRPLLPRLREKVARSFARPRGDGFAAGAVYNQDATRPWPDAVNNLDAVVTSPPFFDSTRFHTGNWMRLWFSGWEASDFKTRPLDFVDERQKASFETYDPVFAQAAERLRSGGLLVLHLGRSRKCDMAAAITPVGTRNGFRVLDLFVESVAHCESHGVRDKGTVTAHQYVVLQRC